MTSLIPALRSAGVECFTRSEWGSPREADGSYQRRRGTHPSRRARRSSTSSTSP